VLSYKSHISSSHLPLPMTMQASKIGYMMESQ
jgi:hypothetical protein